MFDEMIANAEGFCQQLGIAYRVVNIVSGELLLHIQHGGREKERERGREGEGKRDRERWSECERVRVSESVSQSVMPIDCHTIIVR